MFLTYDEYKEFGGTLNEAEFSRFCFRAEATLRTETFGRIKVADEKVKRCIFDLIDVESKTGDGITSVSNDGYSISYFSQGEATQRESDIIYNYFVDDDILYPGEDGAPDYNPTAPTGWRFLLDENKKFILVKAEGEE